MPASLHHLSIPVSDMDRALHLFKDLLGLDLYARIPWVGGRRMSALLGVEGLEMELAFLRGKGDGVSLELTRRIAPPLEPPATPDHGVGVCLHVDGLVDIHQGLRAEGWEPLSDILEMRDPAGMPINLFCFRTDDGVLVELIEERRAGQ